MAADFRLLVHRRIEIGMLETLVRRIAVEARITEIAVDVIELIPVRRLVGDAAVVTVFTDHARCEVEIRREADAVVVAVIELVGRTAVGGLDPAAALLLARRQRHADDADLRQVDRHLFGDRIVVADLQARRAAELTGRTARDRKSTRLNSLTNANLVCRLLLANQHYQPTNKQSNT